MWLSMQDVWTLRPRSAEPDKRHFFECKDSASDTGSSLLTHLAATHAAVVNENSRFYRPDRMQEGMQTFLPRPGRFAAPVLLRHDENSDAIGRVCTAKYIDLSHQYGTEFPILHDSLFYAGSDKKNKVQLYEAVNWIVDNLQDLDDYRGLGYIDLGVKITNPDAIRKVFNEEYLTVSVGFRTDAAICSICHTNWSEEDRCEHKMGSRVDGHKAFLICGKMNFDEVSFVNFGADPFAGVISKEKLSDSLNRMFYLGLPAADRPNLGITMTDSLYVSDIEPAEDPMDNENTELTPDIATMEQTLQDKDLTAEQAFNLKDALASWKPADAAETTKKRSMISTLNAKIRKNGWVKAETAVTAEDAADLAEIGACVAEGQKSTEAEPAAGAAGAAEDSAPAAAAAVETEGALTDAVQAIRTSLQMEDAKHEPFLNTLNLLDDIHGKAELPDRSNYCNCLGSMLEHWHSGNYFSYLKGRLTAADDSITILSKAELADKEEALNASEAEVQSLKDSKSRLETQTAATIRQYKQSLATQIVMGRMIQGVSGYRDTTPEKFAAEVAKLATREVSSLKDTLLDITSTLSWAATEQSAPKANEPGRATDDHAVVTEPDPNPALTDSAAPKPRFDEQTLAKLRAMTPQHRAIALADLDYQEAKARTAKQ